MSTFSRILLAAIFGPVAYSQTDWPVYGHDPNGQRYSPLAEINTKNVAKLKLAWQYGIDAGGVDLNLANRVLSGTEAVPIMVNVILYTPVPGEFQSWREIRRLAGLVTIVGVRDFLVILLHLIRHYDAAGEARRVSQRGR
jgi:hypothetical protein